MTHCSLGLLVVVPLLLGAWCGYRGGRQKIFLNVSSTSGVYQRQKEAVVGTGETDTFFGLVLEKIRPYGSSSCTCRLGRVSVYLYP